MALDVAYSNVASTLFHRALAPPLFARDPHRNQTQLAVFLVEI